MKILKSTGPKTEPYGTPLTTGLQYGVTLSAQPMSQWLNHHMMSLPSCALDILSWRILWETESKLYWNSKRLHQLASLDLQGGLPGHGRKSGMISRTFLSWSRAGCNQWLCSLSGVFQYLLEKSSPLDTETKQSCTVQDHSSYSSWKLGHLSGSSLFTKFPISFQKSLTEVS